MGSGVGAMAESFPSIFELTLVDISEEMLKESQKRNPKKNMSVVTFVIFPCLK